MLRGIEKEERQRREGLNDRYFTDGSRTHFFPPSISNPLQRLEGASLDCSYLPPNYTIKPFTEMELEFVIPSVSP